MQVRQLQTMNSLYYELVELWTHRTTSSQNYEHYKLVEQPYNQTSPNQPPKACFPVVHFANWYWANLSIGCSIEMAYNFFCQ